jgi:hypothetical protein
MQLLAGDLLFRDIHAVSLPQPARNGNPLSDGVPAISRRSDSAGDLTNNLTYT